MSAVFVLLAAFGLPGCGKEAPARVRVELLGAASTTNVLDEIMARFEQKQAVEVRANYAASSTLAQQIENGAPADVFLSANVKWADYLQQRGLVAKRRNLLGNRLVVIVPVDSRVDVAKVEDLQQDQVERIALADPDAAPAGMYAKQALVKLGLWDALDKKVVSAADVRRALIFVETGAAQAGIVYATDAALSDSVKVPVEIDPRLTSPVVYPLVLLTQGADRPEARALFEYLGGPEAAEIFRKHGFTVGDQPPADEKQGPVKKQDGPT
ncbi:MAG: molybdate ABC transporter substrate-binding protein [Pirellulales bacterium]|nr:molybdate ABC transporter substrate-binding protein [Pirellulales bacterium]